MMRLLLSGFSAVSTLKANTETAGILPIPLESYPEAASLSLGDVLAARASFDPFNVIALVTQSVPFFTVTDEANLHPTQFARRWNSFLVRNGSWIVSFIRVLEPQKQGRPHNHLLVAVPFDPRADTFYWYAFDECQRERRIQAELRCSVNSAPVIKRLPRLNLSRFGPTSEMYYLGTGSVAQSFCHYERQRGNF